MENPRIQLHFMNITPRKRRLKKYLDALWKLKAKAVPVHASRDIGG
jgi:hypothetical protein